jgi:hypothetical protein
MPGLAGGLAFFLVRTHATAGPFAFGLFLLQSTSKNLGSQPVSGDRATTLISLQVNQQEQAHHITLQPGRTHGWRNGQERERMAGAGYA